MAQLAEAVSYTAAEPEDLRLLHGVAAGDRAAFEKLYLRYHRRLSRFLMRFAHRYDLAEEIINDTLLVVWNKAGEFREGSQVSTWIIGIAYRRALKSFKSLDTRRNAEARACEEEETLREPPVREHPHERVDWLARGLAELPLEQRMVIELAYFLGHSCEEIAKVMDCPVNTVKTRMFNARKRLRARLPELAEPRTEGGSPS